MTFKEFLIEWDRGDFALQQQASREQQAAQAEQRQKTAFQDKMKSNFPEPGDVIVVGAKQYSAVKPSMKGMVAREIGGHAATTIPQNAKYQLVGKSKDGKKVFKAVVN